MYTIYSAHVIVCSSCLLPSFHGVCLCLCPSPFRTGWFGTVVEYGAERKISRHSVLSATVSIGVPQGVTLKIKYTGQTQNMTSFFCVSLYDIMIIECVCHVCACVCVSMQVGSCQSDIPISSPPDRPAAAQCRLLRHRGTPAGLLGRPQTGHHPIYSATERAVSTFPFFLTPHFTLTFRSNLVLSSGKSLYQAHVKDSSLFSLDSYCY